MIWLNLIIFFIFGVYSSIVWKDRKWLKNENDSLRRCVGRLEVENYHLREEAGTQFNYESVCTTLKDANEQAERYRQKYLRAIWAAQPNPEAPRKKSDVNEKRHLLGKRRRIKLHE